MKFAKTGVKCNLGPAKKALDKSYEASVIVIYGACTQVKNFKAF